MRRPRSLARASAFLALALACGSAQDRFAEHVRRGDAYAQAGDRAKALVEYTSALEFSDDAAIHERLGELLRRQGTTEQAAAHFRRAHELEPARVSALVSEFFLIAASDRPRAVALVEAAEQAAPDSALALRARSELALLSGQLDAAQRAAERAVERAAEAVESELQLGRVLQARVEQRRRAGEPPDPALLAAALAAYERADALAGGNVSTRLERARVLAAWPGREADARSAFDAAIALAEQQAAPDLEIIALHAKNDYARARGDRATRIQTLREITALDGANYSVWRELAALVADDPEAQSALFEALLRARPSDPEAHRFYAAQLVAAGKDQEAVAHLKQSFAELDAPLLADELVQLHLRRLQLPQARKVYEALASDHEADPLTQRVSARLALAEGRADDAVLAISKQADERRGAEDWLLLALSQEQRGELDAASAALARARELQGGFAESIARADARVHCERRDHPGCLARLRALAARRLTLSDSERVMSIDALAATGRGEAALRVLEQLVAVPEPSALAVLEFAKRRGASEGARAEKLLLAAEERKPGDPVLLRALVDRWRGSGRATVALLHVNRRIGDGAPNVALLLLRAELLAESGELAAAETDALRAFEAAPGLAGAVDLLVEVYTRQGRLAQARQSFEEAESAGVLHPGGRLLLARLREIAGDTAGARALLEALLGDRPNMHAAMSELARLLAGSGSELERARELASTAARAKRSSRSAAHALGYVLLESRQYALALAELERASALQEPLGRNSEAELHYHLGLAKAGLARPADARRDLERALAVDPKFRDADAARRKLAELPAAS
jgi:tetratricopeptide (TPR) repeat protein